MVPYDYIFFFALDKNPAALNIHLFLYKESVSLFTRAQYNSSGRTRESEMIKPQGCTCITMGFSTTADLKAF